MTHPHQFARRLLLLFFGAVISTSANAQALDQAIRYFDDGNIRYRQGDFRGALTSYDNAVAEGFVSGALFFNMANAYYRLDETGQAVRYYEKAAEIMPRSAELDHNLEIVREQVIDQFSRLPDPFWMVWWKAAVRFFSTSGLMAIGMIFYASATVALALRIRGGPTPWRRRLFASSSGLALVFLAAGFTASIEDQSANRAVVLIDEVSLLESPEGVRSGLDIHEGLVVSVVVVRDEWMEVRLPNGATGWVRSQALGLI